MPADESSAPAGSVLLVIKGLGLGGAERLLVDQAISNSSRWRYEVAYIRPDKVHFVAQLEAAGISVIPLRPGGSRAWPLHLARHLRAARPDVVHVHAPLPAAVSRVLVRAGVAGRRSAPVYTEHNRWSAYRLPTRLVNAVTMVLDRRVFAVSAEAKGSIWPRWLGRRAEVLHHGIDLVATRRSAEELVAGAPSVPAGAFTFIHVANRRPEKAHGVLLDAFAHAAAEDPDLQLWLVGQGLDDPEFAEAVASHPHADRIAVLGYRSDAPGLIAAADALVLSSDHEGLPVAIMEALALGRPVVATAVGGVPEAVHDGQEGVLVPPRSPERLGRAMVDLARDPHRYAQLASGASAAADRFSAAAAWRTQEDAYDQLTSQRSGAPR